MTDAIRTGHATAGDLTAGTTRYAGARIPRVEDPRLLTGHGTYVDDVVRPGMLHACFVRSPLARARIVSIDATAALDLPGIHAVFTAADLNDLQHEPWYSLAGKDVPGLAAPAARRRRGPLRRRPGRTRGRRRPLPRRGRRRSRRRRVRALAAGRRLPHGPTERAPRARGVREQRVRSDGWSPVRDDRRGVRRCGTRRRADHLPAGVRGVADGDAWHRRRVVGGRRRTHRVGVDAVTARPAALRVPPARAGGEPHPGDRPRHRRRVRPEDQRPPRGHLRDARGAQAAGRAEVRRGPSREPDGQLVTTRQRHGARWPSTPTAPTWRRTSTTCRTSAPIRSPGRSGCRWPPG